MSVEIVLPPSPRPGGRLRAELYWTLLEAPSGGTVTLGWATKGKGDRDAQTVDRRELGTLPRLDGVSAPLKARDARLLELVLPEGPYTFSGALISLAWTLRVVLQPWGLQHEVELVLSPTGKELRLRAL